MRKTRKRSRGSEGRTRRRRQQEAERTAGEAPAASRPTMGAPLEAAVKEATQTQRMETQYWVCVSSPLEIALFAHIACLDHFIWNLLLTHNVSESINMLMYCRIQSLLWGIMLMCRSDDFHLTSCCVVT
jgi:hypothetical protein